MNLYVSDLSKYVNVRYIRLPPSAAPAARPDGSSTCPLQYVVSLLCRRAASLCWWMILRLNVVIPLCD